MRNTIITPIINCLPEEVKFPYTMAILCLALVSFIMGYAFCKLINRGRN